MPDIGFSSGDLLGYVFVVAAALSLVLAVLNFQNIGRAAGLICLAVAVGTVGLIVQGNGASILLYVAGFSFIGALAFIGRPRTWDMPNHETPKPH